MINNSHHSIDAFIEEHEYDWTANGKLCQLITVMMVDELEQLDPAVCAITPEAARRLAFQLLVVAEHAERPIQEDER